MHQSKCCCVTGHRDIPGHIIPYVKAQLQTAIDQAILDGFTHFISGFADGVDQYFAAIVAEKKIRQEGLFLEAAIPYRARIAQLMAREDTAVLFAACNAVKICAEEFRPGVYHARNRWMVNNAQRVIAVYDGRMSGGTIYTMRVASIRGVEVCEIRVAG